MTLSVVSDALVQEHQSLAEAMMLNRELLERALAKVRRFVRDKDLIVYGGLAVHFVHLINDLSIYGENTLPDYDVLSPDNVNHAYEMAQALHAADFPDVSVVRAIHVQTMRVRVGPVAILDITYVPPTLFETLPAENFEGLRFASYKYQLIDMHSIFSFPFKNAPQEDMGYRWMKMERRMNSLLTIVDAKGKGFPRDPPDANAFHTIAIPTLPFPHAIAGFLAVSALYDLYKLMRESMGLEFVPRYAEVITTTATDLHCPTFCTRISVVVDHKTIPKEIVKKIYRPLASIRKRIADADIDGSPVGLRFLDGDLLAVVKIGDLIVPTAHYTMMGLLAMAIEYPDRANVCLGVYADLVDMARAVNQKFRAAQESSHLPPEVILGNPFCVNTRTFGSENYNEAFLVNMRNFIARTEGVPVTPPHILPKNHFFGKKEVKIEHYDYTQGRAYFHDGTAYTAEDAAALLAA
jgi:hypothetical protein